MQVQTSPGRLQPCPGDTAACIICECNDATPKGDYVAGTRALTAAEVALAREAFGGGIDYRRVTIVDGAAANLAARIAFKKGNPAITLGSTVHFKHGLAADFAAPGGDRNGFMHEMTHVWQFQRLGVTRFLLLYAKELMQVRGRANAMYAYRPGETKFVAAMLEAQAQMVGDYAEARAAGWAPKAALLERSLAGSGLYGL